MNKRLTIFAVLILTVLVTSPAYATVKSVGLQKDTYTIDEPVVFTGIEDKGQKAVYVFVIDKEGKKHQAADPFSDVDGNFETQPRDAKLLFTTGSGIYNVTAITEDQKFVDGITIQVKFDGKIISLLPDFDLKLKPIGSKTIDEKSKLSFLAAVTDSSLTGLSFNLAGNIPSGATIDPNSGVFTWIPSETQGPGTYMFDIVVSKGGLEDRESVSITVNEVNDSETLPKTIPSTTEPEPTTNTEPEPEPTQEVPEKQIPAPFVDTTKDPQYYIDRYNNEPSYKAWFEKNYPEYTSIYEAVGVEEPSSEKQIPAPFVDTTKDPQYYIDRYNNEPSYKAWFEKNYPEYTSIYEAVGVEEPKEQEPTIGTCGEGTKLVNGVCVPDTSTKKGGGCLIATAAYGTELAPQVQFLREIRDNTVLSTSSGAAFMTGFNQFYYSFSPTVADWERENPIFQESVRAFITPMVSSLSILTLADQGSESSVLGFGLAVIAFNIGLYIATPTVVGFKVHKYLKSRK